MMGSKAVILAACMCIGSHAWAEATDEAKKVLARKHYQDGTKAFDLGHFDEAIKEYEEAYRNFDDPVLLYNLAQAHRLAGHAADALRLYKVYLNRAPGAKNRTEVQTKIATLEKLVEEQRQSQSLPPDHPIRPGTTATQQPAPQPEPTTTQPTTTATTPRSAAVTPRTATEAKPVDRADRPAVPGRTKKIAGIGLMVVGLGGIGAGIAMGVLSKQAGDSVTSAAKAHQPFDPAKESTGKTDQILEAVFLAVGGVALAGGALLYYFGHREATRAGHHGFVFAPALSPRFAGAKLEVTF